MPWPERIYEGLYRTSPDSESKERIPRHYSTQMQVMINTLNDMPATRTKVSGSGGIGILMANSLMFQRFPTHDGYEDPQLANFYGQALPLLKRGVPVKTVHIENLAYPEALADTKVLLMSYSNMKPLDPEAHEHLAAWVRRGGVLVYSGRDDDPFQRVTEWWNQNGNAYAAPSDHLFELLGIGSAPEAGEYACGKGTVCILRNDPKEFVLEKGGDAPLVETVKRLYEGKARGGELRFKNNFRLERGAYDLVAVLDESVSDEPVRIEGRLIDLFDPELPVCRSREIAPGEQGFFLNVDRVKNPRKARVLASASRIYDEQHGKRSYAFVAKSPVNTTNVSRVLLPECPKQILIDGRAAATDGCWDETTRTCLIRFENNPDGVSVRITW